MTPPAHRPLLLIILSFLLCRAILGRTTPLPPQLVPGHPSALRLDPSSHPAINLQLVDLIDFLLQNLKIVDSPVESLAPPAQLLRYWPSFGAAHYRFLFLPSPENHFLIPQPTFLHLLQHLNWKHCCCHSAPRFQNYSYLHSLSRRFLPRTSRPCFLPNAMIHQILVSCLRGVLWVHYSQFTL